MARKSASDIAKQYLRLRSMPHSLNRSITLNKAYTNALKARGMSRMGVKTAKGYDYHKKKRGCSKGSWRSFRITNKGDKSDG